MLANVAQTVLGMLINGLSEQLKNSWVAGKIINNFNSSAIVMVIEKQSLTYIIHFAEYSGTVKPVIAREKQSMSFSSIQFYKSLQDRERK